MTLFWCSAVQSENEVCAYMITFKLLSFPLEDSFDHCSSITKSSIYHIKHMSIQAFNHGSGLTWNWTFTGSIYFMFGIWHTAFLLRKAVLLQLSDVVIDLFALLCNNINSNHFSDWKAECRSGTISVSQMFKSENKLWLPTFFFYLDLGEAT